MSYYLSPTSKPDYIIVLDARHAEALNKATHMAERLIEVTSSPTGPHGSGKLGVMVKQDTHLFGRINLSKPEIDNPLSLEEFGLRLKLNSQRDIAAELKRAFSGGVKMLFSSASEALQGAALYFVFYDLGAVIIAPRRDDLGRERWRFGAIRLEGARTMEEERACVAINRSSLATYAILWEGLADQIKKEVEEDPSLKADLVDAVHEGRAPGNAALAKLHAARLREEDALDEDSEGLRDEGSADESGGENEASEGLANAGSTSSTNDAEPVDFDMDDVQF